MAQNKGYKKGRHRLPKEQFSLAEADDRIYDIFRNHDWGDYPHDKRHQLVRFYQMLIDGQKQQNFTRLVQLKDIAIKHFLDCLLVSRHLPLPSPLLDIGSGAGFPGIPLKIDQPQTHIILAEGVQKRVEFLKQVREEFQFAKLDIIGRNINEDFAYPVAGTITRAVQDISKTLGNVLNCLNTSGQAIFMKGPNVDQELLEVEQKWSQYYQLTTNLSYEIPNTPHKRRLVVYTKIKAAPTRQRDLAHD